MVCCYMYVILISPGDAPSCSPLHPVCDWLLPRRLCRASGCRCRHGRQKVARRRRERRSWPKWQWGHWQQPDLHSRQTEQTMSSQCSRGSSSDHALTTPHKNFFYMLVPQKEFHSVYFDLLPLTKFHSQRCPWCPIRTDPVLYSCYFSFLLCLAAVFTVFRHLLKFWTFIGQMLWTAWNYAMFEHSLTQIYCRPNSPWYHKAGEKREDLRKMADWATEVKNVW